MIYTAAHEEDADKRARLLSENQPKLNLLTNLETRSMALSSLRELLYLFEALQNSLQATITP